MNAWSRAEVVKLAWLEWRVAASYAGTLGEEMRACERPPAWFVSVELGFGFACGPSLLWTMDHLGRTNHRALAQLGSNAPRRVTWPANFAAPRAAPESRRNQARGARACAHSDPLLDRTRASTEAIEAVIANTRSRARRAPRKEIRT